MLFAWMVMAMGINSYIFIINGNDDYTLHIIMADNLDEAIVKYAQYCGEIRQLSLEEFKACLSVDASGNEKVNFFNKMCYNCAHEIIAVYTVGDPIVVSNKWDENSEYLITCK